ncbi:hypothetical protein BaRGS_00016205 [Batillaria attramentaria]|uniref:Nucleoporin NUP42 n=1 Tax=Batillaria attramentaria TaxID=370345 RepID=A0ABD0KZ76_9CAEN
MSFPLCKFFNSQQGCRFGNKCRYKHSKPSFSPTSEFLLDKQNEGSVRSSNLQADSTSVETRHSQEPLLQNDASVSSDQQPEACNSQTSSLKERSSEDGAPVNAANTAGSSPSFITQADQESGAADQQDGSSVSAANSQQWKSVRRPCHYFARYGNCHYGNRCRFEHVRSQRLPPRFQGQQNPADSADGRDGAAYASQDGEGERSTEGEGMKGPRKAEQNASSSHIGEPAIQEAAPPCEYEEQEVEQEERGAMSHGAGKDSRNKRGWRERSGKVCQFYLSGRCWRGNRCKFVHPRFDAGSSAGEVTEQLEAATIHEGKMSQDQKHQRTANASQKRQPQPKVPYIPQGVKKWKREEVDDVQAAKLRRTEIDLLQKRFPKSKLQVKKDSLELFDCIVTFVPTDPDWPFDVKAFDLQVTIPADYPLEMLSITLPTEQNLPETVRRYVEVSIAEWLEEKKRQLDENNQVEQVFRPFLRWLDKNIEDIVTDALRQLKRELVAKSAGLEFISAKELQKQYPGQGDDSPDEDDYEENETDSENTQTSESGNEEESDSEYDEYESEEDDQAEEDRSAANQTKKAKQDKLKAMLADPERKGTEITLKNMQLRESAAAMYFDKIYLAIQCERCKGTSEFLTSGGRVNVVQCGRCGQTQVATFRPALVHHFSSTIGFLDLDACLPFDVILQNCCSVVTCLNCSKETKMGAVLPGQPQDHWCRACHKKLKIATEGVRFTQLGPSSTTQEVKGAVRVVVPRQRRLPKDPAIQEGKPLPNFGTCKHYKKSYRWLRFPCCGKCYPCDICHDSKEDHEMKFANRMICGFCCKEQMYAAEKPCKGCDLNLTKVRTQHWEGGQGCRDKIAMSKNDKQKHRNMSKTVSKHSQKVKDMQSKKKTKLRHT